LSNIVLDAFLINAKQDAVVQQVGYVSSASDTGIAP